MQALILLSILLMIIVGVFIYNTNAVTEAKLIALPILLLTLLFGYNIYEKELGRPIYDRPVGEFTYHSHLEIGNMIELIAEDKVSSRIYIFIPTQAEREALDKANSESESGIDVAGQFIMTPGGDSESEGGLETWPKEEQPK